MKAEEALNKALDINRKIAQFNISNVNVDHLITEAEKIKEEVIILLKSTMLNIVISVWDSNS